jgi:hypothetical protein
VQLFPQFRVAFCTCLLGGSHDVFGRKADPTQSLRLAIDELMRCSFCYAEQSGEAKMTIKKWTRDDTASNEKKLDKVGNMLAQPDELDALRPVKDKALRLECFLTPDQLNPLLFADRPPLRRLWSL